MLHRDDVEGFERWCGELQKSQKLGQTEVRFRRADGEYRWFQISVAPVHDEQGRLIRWYGINIDIDDRKRAEEALWSSEKSLQLMVNSIPGLIHTATAEGQLEVANRQTLEYFGKTVEELRKWTTGDAVHPDDLPYTIEAVRRAVQTGEPASWELRLRRADGVYRWFQYRSLPKRDSQRRISGWYSLLTDIEDRRRTEEALRSSERNLAAIINTIPTTAWTTRPDGYCDFLNQVWLDYAGMTAEQAQGWGWADAIHPDDRKKLVEDWQSCLGSGTPVDTEARIRRFDASYRWFLIRANPLRDESGNILKWYGTCIDIEDRKRVEEALRASELSCRQIVDNIPGLVATMGAMGEVEFLNRQTLEYFGKTNEELKNWSLIGVVHPDDLPHVIEKRRKSIEEGRSYEVEHRCRRADGVYRWFQVRGLPVRNEEGTITAWYLLLTDIDDRKRAEEALRSSERSLRLMVDSIPGHVALLTAEGEVEVVNRQILEYCGKTIGELKDWTNSNIIHPDDLQTVIHTVKEGVSAGEPFEYEHRIRRADGVYLWYHIRWHPQRDRGGQIVRWYILATDIDDRKRAEQKLRQSEEYLRTITDCIRQAIGVLSPDGAILYANRVALESIGLPSLDDKTFFRRVIHPDDADSFRAARQKGLLHGTPFETEVRLLMKNRQYRWYLMQYNPLKDESGQIIRWYVTATDIDNRKKMEEQLRSENLVLREEIDRSSMFEEIVGSSKPMRQLLKHVEKVAPADSTVLILGETGTGKELVARALHKRSKRANRAFVRVNCAAIPQSLIATELFGHEKGAFTGALQRRMGRFEAANGGTLFLDEIGELPMETQISLLRVLQEREFERVGSNHPISVDVRLIAATNRDLSAAVAAGTFRQDLFYRLNVFPIEVPALRERKEDIPLLVEYFVDRYAGKTGKKITGIGKMSMEVLQSYKWPGNIRE